MAPMSSCPIDVPLPQERYQCGGEGEFCGGNSKDRAEKSRRAVLESCSEEGSPYIRKGLSAHTGKGDFIPKADRCSSRVCWTLEQPDSQAVQVLCKDTTVYKHTEPVP